DRSLLKPFASVVVDVCNQELARSRTYNEQANAQAEAQDTTVSPGASKLKPSLGTVAITHTIAKFMCVSERFCRSQIHLLIDLLSQHPSNVVRGNFVIALSDLSILHNSIIDHFTEHLYSRLQDDDSDVQRTTVVALTFLILAGQIKVKEFVVECKNLRSQISSAFNDNTYHRGVPIDGWPVYASQIWQKIEDNKDLDLPSHHVLVAKFRCEEISNEAFTQFTSGCAEIKELGSSTLIPEFGDLVSTQFQTALKSYDDVAGRYNKQVYETEREALLLRLKNEITPWFDAQMKAVLTKILGDIKSNLASSPQSKPFVERLQSIVQDAEKESILARDANRLDIIREDNPSGHPMSQFQLPTLLQLQQLADTEYKGREQWHKKAILGEKSGNDVEGEADREFKSALHGT
ncbi:hypothetical protein FF38_07663, partial [Lucilia cuprina]